MVSGLETSLTTSFFSPLQQIQCSCSVISLRLRKRWNFHMWTFHGFRPSLDEIRDFFASSASLTKRTKVLKSEFSDSGAWILKSNAVDGFTRCGSFFCLGIKVCRGKLCYDFDYFRFFMRKHFVPIQNRENFQIFVNFIILLSSRILTSLTKVIRYYLLVWWTTGAIRAFFSSHVYFTWHSNLDLWRHQR